MVFLIRQMLLFGVFLYDPVFEKKDLLDNYAMTGPEKKFLFFYLKFK